MMATKFLHVLNRTQHSSLHKQPSININDTSSISSSLKPSLALLGKPSAKKPLHTSEILAAVLSLTCFVLAVTVVASENVGISA
jgi:hypothetical protein